MKITVPFECKRADKATGRFEGVASPFGELDQGGDIVMPGAFTKTLAEYQQKGRKVPMLWQHKSDEPIGVYVELKETSTGLEVVGECNMKVQRGQECHALMEQGSLTGLSIGYKTERAEYVTSSDTRLLHELKLWEISPVTFPMADSARASVVKSLEGVQTLADCEAILRDAGFSRKEALAFTARVKSIVTRSDSVLDGDASINRVLSILRSR